MRWYDMKRMILILGICLLLTACTKEPYSDAQLLPDAQNQFSFSNAFSFQETDGFFCGNGFSGSSINYYDKASGISGVLCADPACAHDSVNCSGYMKTGATLSVYDGKLWWIGKDSRNDRDYALWRSDFAGTNREQVKHLSFEEVIVKYQPQRYVVHQGMLYLLGDVNEVVGTEFSSHIILLSTPLDDSEEFKVLFEESFECAVNWSVRFVGSHAYISMITFVPGEGQCDLTVVKLDLTTGKSETVYVETAMTASIEYTWVTAQGELYLPGADENYAYVWKLEDGKRVEIASWEAIGSAVPDVMDGIAFYMTWENGIRGAEIVDLEGNPLYSGSLFPERIEGIEGDPNAYSIALIGGDAQKIIVNIHELTDNGPVDYTIALDLENGLKPTILWSGQQ